MRRGPWLSLCCTLVLAAARAAPQAAPARPAPSQPAAWQSYDLILDLQQLPRAYSCDELWYKLHDVLLALGARLHEILPYHCGPGERSPSVHVRFELPAALQGAAVRWADVRAAERAVELAPGHPQRLGAQDCALVQQLRATLLASIPVRITDARFDCRGAQPGREAFSVSLRALEPLPGKPGDTADASR